MNLPISLTLLRIFFVPLVVVLLLTSGRNMDLWAVVVFLLAATTDLLDGYLARKRGQVTSLGILLDPIANKLLTSAAFISLVYLHLISAWMAMIIIGREFAVSGLRAIASGGRFLSGSFRTGKDKDGLSGCGDYRDRAGAAVASAPPPGQRPAMDGGSLRAGVCGTVFHFLLEEIGHTHQAPCLRFTGQFSGQARRKKEEKDVAAH